jgi:hypothetical protein
VAGTAPRKKQNVKALLAGAQRAVRTVEVCTRADLADEYGTLDARIKKARADGADSLAGSPELPEMIARLDELRDEMRAASITFKLRALPRREYTQVVAQNPPREGEKADALLGMNIDEVIEQLIRRGTEEPELDAADWEVLLGEALNQATYAQLTDAAWSLNTRDVTTPF